MGNRHLFSFRRGNIFRPPRYEGARTDAWGFKVKVFDRLEELLDAGDLQCALAEARALTGQIERRSNVVSGAIDDFLIDLMTLAFVAEAFGNHLADAARKLARRRLSKVRLLTLN